MLISIVIPTYNRASIISDTLNSISSQLFGEWECLVVDDYSVDNTEEVVNEYVKKDSRFRYCKNECSKGAQGARNTGILQSQGEWVVLFDSDNIMHRDYLKVLSARIKDDVDVIGCWSRVIDKDDKRQISSFSWEGYGNVHDNLMTGKSYFDNSSTIIRKNKLIEAGLLDENCPSFQEWDTHIRLSRIAQYDTIKEYLVDYISGGADAISSDLNREVKGYLYVLSKFRTEWRSSHLLAFIKYCYVLRYKIDRLKVIKPESDYEKQYHNLTSFFERTIVGLIMLLKK